MPIDYALLTDLYEITMAQGYRDSGHENTEACFHMYFRDTPFKGGYAIACGMAQLADMVDTYAFSGEDIDYLSKIPAPGGGALFAADFLEWLRDFKLTVDIDAVPEGQVVFPNEPLVRVKGPIMQCQLLEAALLNCVNFQTLIATKAARVCLAAQDAPVAEFGLRRAQGAGGGLWASRASIVGGCASTRGQDVRPSRVGHARPLVGHGIPVRARGVSGVRGGVSQKLHAARGHLQCRAGHRQRDYRRP